MRGEWVNILLLSVGKRRMAESRQEYEGVLKGVGDEYSLWKEDRNKNR